jgi:hypothetical protein
MLFEKLPPRTQFSTSAAKKKHRFSIDVLEQVQ